MRLPLFFLIPAFALLTAGCSDSSLPTSTLSDPLDAKTDAERCRLQANATSKKLLDCVTVEGVYAHMVALQSVADANGGNRAAGLPGYSASVDYVVGQLMDAGYDVTTQSFEINPFYILPPSVLEIVSPPPTESVAHDVMLYSGSGDVTAPISRPSPDTGCEVADFSGFPAGHIALIERNDCFFSIKATNAYNAGAIGVVIYNDRPELLRGSLSSEFTLDIPVVGISQADGLALASTPGLVMRLKTETLRGPFTTYNVIAETSSGNADNVVVLGAHLDSVLDGPGIQDNGSGSAALLETAIQMAKVRPVNKIRFAWWGSGEFRASGSQYYLDDLSDAELGAIALYLNFDMIASPNYVFMVYDGDGSEGGSAGADGSGAIEALFADYYDSIGQPFRPVGLADVYSDHSNFSYYGFPVGGLFTGAEQIKTPEEAGIWGGVAGEQYDPCNHLACDTADNLNFEALDVNADAVAHAALAFGMGTQDTRGRGRRPFSVPPTSDPVTE